MAKILSISYDPNLLKTRELLLEQMGYSVVSAEGFAQAFRLCKAEHYDLVILGHSIPEEDKDAIAKGVLENCNCPILALLRPNERRARIAKRSISTENPKEFIAAVKEMVSGHPKRPIVRGRNRRV